MSDDVLKETGLENPEEQDEEESFAELFESYAEGMNEDVRVGDKVKGAIISIGRDSVFVDTGTKTDGFVEKTELLDEEGKFNFEVGDVLELYAVAVTGTEIRLSKAIAGIGGAGPLLFGAVAAGLTRLEERKQRIRESETDPDPE